jgi:CheY-like chemotaxis protein
MAGDGRRVLVVEDEPVIRMLVVEVLEDAGYTVLQASNGLEAMQLIEQPDHFALIVTDINMPGADGIQVIERARATAQDLPVVFMSGRPRSHMARDTPQPCRYFGKPFPLPDLVAAVDELLTVPA